MLAMGPVIVNESSRVQRNMTAAWEVSRGESESESCQPHTLAGSRSDTLAKPSETLDPLKIVVNLAHWVLMTWHSDMDIEGGWCTSSDEAEDESDDDLDKSGVETSKKFR